MQKSRIYNIIFYNSKTNKGLEKKAIIIYLDGRKEYVTGEEGVEACEKLFRNKGISLEENFQELLNKEHVFIVSEQEAMDNIDKYIPTKEIQAIHSFMDETQKEDVIRPSVPLDLNSLTEEESEELDPLFWIVMEECTQENNKKIITEGISKFYETFNEDFIERTASSGTIDMNKIISTDENIVKIKVIDNPNN